MNGEASTLIRRLLIGVTVSGAVFLSGLAASQSTLPPSVRAELLDADITAAIQRHDYATILDKIHTYHSLPGVVFPPPLLVIEAKAAYATGDKQRAKTALERFFNSPSNDPDQHRDAVALYAKIQGETTAKSRAEMKIQWLGSTTGNLTGILKGRVIIGGQTVEVTGFTVQCTHQSPPRGRTAGSISFRPIPFGESSGSEASGLALEEGRRDGAQLQIKEEEPYVYTLHIIEGPYRHSAQYAKPPWHGWYDWGSTDFPPTWRSFSSSSEKGVTLWDLEYVAADLEAEDYLRGERRFYTTGIATLFYGETLSYKFHEGFDSTVHFDVANDDVNIKGRCGLLDPIDQRRCDQFAAGVAQGSFGHFGTKCHLITYRSPPELVPTSTE
jgi:hypothetical protein